MVTEFVLDISDDLRALADVVRWPRASRGGWLTELRLDHHDAVAGGDEEREQVPESTRGALESSLTGNISTT